MQVFYSLSGVNEVIYMVLIPLFVTLIFYSIFVLIYSAKMRNKDQREKNYVISFWSSVIGIVFGAVLLSVSIGFVIALMRRVETQGLIVSNQTLYTIFCFFPVIPLIFLLSFIWKFIKTLKYGSKLYTDEKEKEEEEIETL